MDEERQIRGRPVLAEGQPRPRREQLPVVACANRPVGVQALGALQRAAGNRAVTRVLAGACPPAVPVQRQPGARLMPPRTQRWQFDEPYKGQAVMHRTTTIEATAWAETKPASPRILYRREVELKTSDGITV